MIYASLLNFSDKAFETGQISFGDVKRLTRDILPDGITTREEADLLILLDRAATKVDPAWSTWLIAAMVDYAVWGARPTGIIDAALAGWLKAALSGDGSTERAAVILQEIVREAEAVDPGLMVARSKPAQVDTEAEIPAALLTA